MNGEHRSLLALVNLCLSACGQVVVNNTHCRSWPEDIHVGNEQLCIIHNDVDGHSFRGEGLVILQCC